MGEFQKVVSPRGAAELLSLQSVIILRWIKSGKLLAYRLANGYLRVRLADLQQFLTPANPKRKRIGQKHGH